MANSVDQNQNAPIGAVCSWSKLFASILNSSVMLGNYLQQTTPTDDTFRCIFFLGALRYNPPVNEKFDVKNPQTVFNYKVALSKAMSNCPQLILVLKQEKKEIQQKCHITKTIDNIRICQPKEMMSTEASRLHFSRFDKS